MLWNQRIFSHFFASCNGISINDYVLIPYILRCSMSLKKNVCSKLFDFFNSKSKRPIMGFHLQAIQSYVQFHGQKLILLLSMAALFGCMQSWQHQCYGFSRLARFGCLPFPPSRPDPEPHDIWRTRRLHQLKNRKGSTWYKRPAHAKFWYQ